MDYTISSLPMQVSSCPLPPQQRTLPRPKVLIVLHSDGWVEAYAEKNVDVHIVQRLHITNPVNVNLADEYIESTVPRCYRDLYWPVKLRAISQCRLVTPEQRLDAHLDLQLLREIRNLGEVFKHE
jgi:hypothetical protein